MRQGEKTVSDAYRAHRPYLVDLAFRMLGDLGAAEDVVQDAFSRFMGAGTGEIEDYRGWLIVVTSRLCLDQIRSARARRERAHDAAKIEFVAPPQSELADPADRITFDDRVRIALLVMLQRLSPAERVVFVLHDVFGTPFDTIAETVGRSAPACRQLARRARQKIAAGQAGLSPSGLSQKVMAGEHRAVTEKFLTACATGDIDSLLEVLDPDAWGELVLGPEAARRETVVTGAERVARNLVRFWGEGATLVSLSTVGQPALLGFVDGRLTAVLTLIMRRERIQAVQVIADPRLLEFVSTVARTGVTPASAAHLPNDVTIRRPVSSLPAPPHRAACQVARPIPCQHLRDRHAQSQDHYWQHAARPGCRPGDPLDRTCCLQPCAFGPHPKERTDDPSFRTSCGPCAKARQAGAADTDCQDRHAPDDQDAQSAHHQLAGRPHFYMAAQLTHTGRRSGRTYVTPVGARRAGDAVLIPLTFGNQSDWSRNVLAAGHCLLRLEGIDYDATTPTLLSQEEADSQARVAFGRLERASMRVLGIRQFLRLSVVPIGS